MSGKLSPTDFRKRIGQLSKLADLRGARFEGDTAERRRRRIAESVALPERFNHHYLHHYFDGPTARFHQVLYLLLLWERLMAVRVPRGHAKTTVVTFAYVLHQVVCGPILRAFNDGTLGTADPELHAEIVRVMEEYALAAIAHGPLTRAELELPDHWDPKVDADVDALLQELYEKQVAFGPRVPLHWDPYIQILGADLGTALEFTGSIRSELELNPLIQADFGDLTPCYTGDWRKKRRQQASDEDFESNDIRVRAFGLDGDIRGGKHGPHRPTLLVGDDPDSERTTRTAAQRDANARKIDAGAEPGLDPNRARIMLLGTPHTPDCLLVRYTENEKYRARWKRLRMRADDEHGRRLFGGRFSAERLGDLRDQDRESYESEYGDRPPALGGRPFTELHYYRRADFEGLALPMVMAFDPSLGRTQKSDYQALVTLRGPTAEGKILVHRARFFRIGDPLLLTETVEAAREEDRPDLAVAEAISAGSIQEMLLSAHARSVGLVGWTRIERQAEGKDLRIRSLAPDVNGGWLVFPDDGSCRELELQFLGYGQPGAKRDGPDVTEMARRYLRSASGPQAEVRHGRRERAWLRNDGRPPKERPELVDGGRMARGMSRRAAW